MAISAGFGDSETETALLAETVDGVVDFKGRPVLRSSSGNWKAAAFIITVEVAERFAYYGVNSNLINYLTGPLGQSTATAAENVNAWSGTASLLPLLGAFVADSYLGRYRTVIVASLLYILALSLLTLSAIVPVAASDGEEPQIILFFVSLYLVALAQGGHKPCVQAFGADQFDTNDPEECKARSSFFNWWYFTISAGLVVTISILNYIQDNVGWVLGFGIPCFVMLIALAVFSLGTWTYRFSIRSDERGPFSRIGRVFVAAFKNWRTTPSAIDVEDDRGAPPSEQFRRRLEALMEQALNQDRVSFLRAEQQMIQVELDLLLPQQRTLANNIHETSAAGVQLYKKAITLDNNIIQMAWQEPILTQEMATGKKLKEDAKLFWKMLLPLL